MTKKEYFDELRAVFIKSGMHEEMPEDLWRNGDNELRNTISKLGLRLSNVYHAHGIGNNNEYYIFKEDTDDDGFVIEKKVAVYHYCYGLYGNKMIGVTLREA